MNDFEYGRKEMVNRVKIMHKHFGISHKDVAFSANEKIFRRVAMIEEIDEHMQAKTKADKLDALVDLVVFALSTAEREGFIDSFHEAFDRVMDANMEKEIGKNAKRGNFKFDLVKPEGWVAPDLSDLVEKE